MEFLRQIPPASFFTWTDTYSQAGKPGRTFICREISVTRSLYFLLRGEDNPMDKISGNHVSRIAEQFKVLGKRKTS